MARMNNRIKTSILMLSRHGDVRPESIHYPLFIYEILSIHNNSKQFLGLDYEESAPMKQSGPVLVGNIIA